MYPVIAHDDDVCVANKTGTHVANENGDILMTRDCASHFSQETRASSDGAGTEELLMSFLLFAHSPTLFISAAYLHF
jgi:hypothetical protein